MTVLFRGLALAMLAALLAGCMSAPTDHAAAAIAGSPWALQSRGPVGAAAQPWSHQAFPGKKPTDFRYVRLDGRDAIAVDARASASMLRRKLRVEPQDLGLLRFSWRVAGLMADADLATRDKDDAAVRLVLVFEGDRSRFTPRDAALSELARALTGEELPYATLMYVWSNWRAPGTVIRSPRTDRIRKLVLESGGGRLHQWLDYERDIRADYEHVFGEPPGALVGVGLMTDSDNTRSRAQAWYGPVRIGPAH
jgi:hypothetical protein